MAQPESNAPVSGSTTDAPAPLVTKPAARASPARHTQPPPSLPTRLETFLKSRGIRPTHLGRACGYSRQHLLRIRMGRMDPTRQCIAAITRAVQALSRERVEATDLFDLG